jgi:hypothetical protein
MERLQNKLRLSWVTFQFGTVQRGKPSSIFSALHPAILIATLGLGLDYFAFPPLTSELKVPIQGAGASLKSYQAAGKDTLSGSLTGRAVYPYSAIPGGASSSKELVAALRIDSVARGHDADFNVAAARIIRVAADRKAYVSYRKVDKICWTRKQVNLHAGETLLSNGEHLARTRCGNRVSEVARSPVSPDEPAETAGDAPIGPRFPVTTTDANLGIPLWGASPGDSIVLTAANLNALPMPSGTGGGPLLSGMPGGAGGGCCFVIAPISGTHTTPPDGGGGPPESGHNLILSRGRAVVLLDLGRVPRGRVLWGQGRRLSRLLNRPRCCCWA